MANEDFIINNTQNSLIGEDLAYMHKDHLNFSIDHFSVNGWSFPSIMTTPSDANHQSQILPMPNQNYDPFNRSLVSTQNLPVYNSPITETPSKYPFISTDSYSKVATFQESIINISHNYQNYIPFNIPMFVEPQGINDISNNFGENTMWDDSIHNKVANTSGYEPILDNSMVESHPSDLSVPEGIKSATTNINQIGDQENNGKINKGKWFHDENRTLRNLVELYGAKEWNIIANMLGTRIGKQCRERWHNHLCPTIEKKAWSEKEDQILIEAHKVYGNKWTKIAQKLSGRSENTVKNRWHAAKRRMHLMKKKQSNKNANPPQSDILENYIRQITVKNDPPKTNETENTKSGDDDCENLIDGEINLSLDVTTQTTKLLANTPTTSDYIPEQAETFSWDDYFTRVCESMDDIQKLMDGWY